MKGIWMDLLKYDFKEIHPLVRFGTASDRYYGWIGQIYYQKYKITERTKYLGKQKFNENILEIFHRLISVNCNDSGKENRCFLSPKKV